MIKNIVILLLICCLLLAFLILITIKTNTNNEDMRGGYSDDDFKTGDGRSITSFIQAIKDFETVRDGSMDKYCKAISFYFFGDMREETKSISSKNMLYINGGYSWIENMNDAHEYIHNRMDIQPMKSFSPDFDITIDKENTLIIEFDEGNGHHQDNDDIEYMLKNLIYDQILCQSYVNEHKNICILRIHYNTTIIKYQKLQAVETFVKIIEYVKEEVKQLRFKSQYIIANIKASQTSLNLEYLISIKPSNYELLKTFTPANPFYASIELSKDHPILPKFMPIRSLNDFLIDNLLNDYENKIFVNYKGSIYQSYFESRKSYNLINFINNNEENRNAEWKYICKKNKTLMDKHIRNKDSIPAEYIKDTFDSIIESF